MKKVTISDASSPYDFIRRKIEEAFDELAESIADESWNLDPLGESICAIPMTMFIAEQQLLKAWKIITSPDVDEEQQGDDNV